MINGNDEQAKVGADRFASVAEHFSNAFDLHQRGQLKDAWAAYQVCLDKMPGHPDALHLQGVIRAQSGDLLQAVSLISQALEQQPDHPIYLGNRGNAYGELGQFQQALNDFDRALTLKPDFADALANRSNVLKALGQFDAAIAGYDRALKLKPYFPDVWNNRGLVLQARGEFAAAIASYDQALVQNSGFIEAWNNRGVALQQSLCLDEAMHSFDRAILLRPDDPRAYNNKALLLLLMGDYLNGWQLFEWRWKFPESGILPRNFSVPCWRGDEPLSGKTILLHAEQGFGDTLQMCRYVTQVAALGANVIVEVQPPLLALISHNFSEMAICICRGDTIPDFDLHCSLMSLPLAFRTTDSTIPVSIPYLQASPKKIEHWADQIGERTRRCIGLVWHGNPCHKNDKNRSIELTRLLSILTPGPQYVSLQKGLSSEDRITLASRQDIQLLGDNFESFEDTAAVCELMDEIISVDTSVAHLAGALGKDTLVLLPDCPDWRWGLGFDRAPWYPCCKLIRISEALRLA